MAGLKRKLVDQDPRADLVLIMLNLQVLSPDGQKLEVPVLGLLLLLLLF